MGENMTQHDHVGRHADRDRSEQPAVTTPDDERVQRYAEALRDCIKARTVPPVIGTGGGLSLGATEWDMARAVMAVADAEHAELRAALTELAPSDEVLVEDSCFPRADLPRILGNFMRSSAEHARMAETAERALADERAKVARVERLMAHLHTDLVYVGDLRAALAGPEPDTTEG